MGDAVILMISGMAIVFSVLVITIFLIKVLTAVTGKSNNRNKKEKKKKAELSTVQKEQDISKSFTEEKAQVISSAHETIPAGGNDEVIAAISAAVAYLSMCDGKEYKVKSIKPSGYSRPVWGVAGMYENTVRF